MKAETTPKKSYFDIESNSQVLVVPNTKLINICRLAKSIKCFSLIDILTDIMDGLK